MSRSSAGICFTGSDWNRWHVRLNDEVFSTDDFKSAARAHFVLVEIDFPRDPSLLSDEGRAQNERWAKHFDVKGFPTIILADAAGKAYARTGYRPVRRPARDGVQTESQVWKSVKRTPSPASPSMFGVRMAVDP